MDFGMCQKLVLLTFNHKEVLTMNLIEKYFFKSMFTELDMINRGFGHFKYSVHIRFIFGL